ncbi:MAG: hypothetical protein ACLP8A_13935 [Methylovirgula sp.]
MIVFTRKLTGVFAALAIGLAVMPVSNAAAFDTPHHVHGHHRWQSTAAVWPNDVPYTYAYGDGPRNIAGYFFTSSDFCIPDRNNGYNGGFATLAYDSNGRTLGYVCE